MWFWLNVIPQEIVVNSWMFRCVDSKLVVGGKEDWGELCLPVFATTAPTIAMDFAMRCGGRAVGAGAMSHLGSSSYSDTFPPSLEHLDQLQIWIRDGVGHAVEPTSDYCIINESANILHQFSMEIVFMPKKHKSLQSVTRKSFTFRR